MDYQTICWIASYPKSGNTWFRLFLDAYYLGEVDINDMVCSLSDDAVSRAQVGDGSHPWKYPIHIQQLTRPMALLRLVRAFADNKFSDIPLFVKTHNANISTNGIELLPAMLTKAMICIVRDPRDVVLSYAKHMGKTVDQAIDMMCDKYQTLIADESRMSDVTSSWNIHTNSFLHDKDHNVLIIQYEDMKANPVDTFSKMLKHAGVEVDKEKVRKAVKIVDIKNLKKREKASGFKESSPNAKNQFFGTGIGWSNELTPKQRYRIEKQFGSVMKKLGYLEKRRVA